MSEIKVTQLPTAAGMLGPDWLMIVSGSSNKKISFQNLLKSIRTDLIVNSNNEAASFKIYGQSTNSLLVSDPVLGRIGIGTATPTALLQVAGNLQVGDNGVSGVLLNSHESIVVDGTATKTSTPGIGITRFTFNAGSTALNVNLSNGVPYQTKTFVVSATPLGGVCNINILPTPWVAGGTAPSIKLTKLGDSVTLVYDETGWALKGYFGASIV